MDRPGRRVRTSERHVELLSGILSGEGEDRQLSTGMFTQEAGHVQHLQEPTDVLASPDEIGMRQRMVETVRKA